ncbi:MAG: pyrroloquinoline quinone biosynthesis peptide chaperone PqqD [Gammaproteobacteria bacterium]|nr:pyrroloquinoline quinone biosynthesis peptide chaperone PqqD [Gammaproteobacteria bacterium]
MTTLDVDSIYGLAPGHRLQFEEAQQAWVVLYPEGMVKLNESASDILRRCDGKATLSTIVTDLEQTYDQVELRDDVIGLVSAALDQGWLKKR